MLNVLKEFYQPLIESKTIYMPSPTWGNHQNMVRTAGLKVGYYRYYDLNERKFTFEKMMEDL